MKNAYTILVLLFSSLFLANCNEKDPFFSDAPTDYQSLAVGKYVVYRLDSLLYVNFGQKDTLIKYQAKDVVEAAITDGLGRPAWRVVRYLRDTAGLTPWKENITYMVVGTSESLEIIENNLRFVKIKLPIRQDFSWKGNSYINTSTTDPTWIFKFYENWDYTYDKVGFPYTSFSKEIPNTITINQADNTLGLPGVKTVYSERIFSKEVYAKDIGLIYRDFLYWTFQPQTTNYPHGYYQGFGIKMQMIEHN
jgi:hypothetical protein